MASRPCVLGVIGGSGLYDVPEIEVLEELHVSTPFGPPSSPVVKGRLDQRTIFFLARHGEGHVLAPSEVPYRANVWAMKSLGVNTLLSVSAVGSLKEEIQPGHLVVPDQIIDRTRGIRPATFFGEGVVAHVALADPYCADLSALVTKAACQAGATVHQGGTLVVMEGPQFSTRAESFLYRSFNASLIGMTAMPEAKLAREASLVYATLALATDYDCWHETHESVTVEGVFQVMKGNNVKARNTLLALIPMLGERTCHCSAALQHAVVTRSDVIPAETRRK
ncbi:MAG: S-methyl-5'-thioadenosine phosphorylase, partial [Deltaproteobacteria bacterium]|nr:S-methyl-5'-thioadenosine phosphorylase [Deltaproteobacteria bacterium]